MVDGSLQNNLEQVWNEILDYYTEHKLETQFTHLELSSFHHQGSYPSCLARYQRSRIWFMHCMMFGNSITILLWCIMLVDDMLHNQCEAQEILAHHKDKRLLPIDDTILLAHHEDNVLVEYSSLAYWADMEGCVLCNVAPKHHELWHNTKQQISIPESCEYHAWWNLHGSAQICWQHRDPMAVMHTEYTPFLLKRISGHCICISNTEMSIILIDAFASEHSIDVQCVWWA